MFQIFNFGLFVTGVCQTLGSKTSDPAFRISALSLMLCYILLDFVVFLYKTFLTIFIYLWSSEDLYPRTGPAPSHIFESDCRCNLGPKKNFCTFLEHIVFDYWT